MTEISQAAIDLIVAEEVSSEQVYRKKYQHPEWPGGASGITIGIGYDCGYQTPGQIRSDWGAFLSPDMIETLCRTAGKHGAVAREMLPGIKSYVTVSWEAAMAVFTNHDVPKWTETCRKALPHFDELTPDCKGALVSLAYNRGASFAAEGGRYMEMRQIRADMLDRKFSDIPKQFRAMKRLWPGVDGLIHRREHEAVLFERGLAAITAPEPAQPNAPSAFRRGTATAPVNMRAGAGTDNAVIQTLAKDDRFEIIGEQMNDDTKWLHINLGSGESGWVAARFVVETA